MKTKTLKINITQIKVAKLAYGVAFIFMLVYLFLVNQISFAAASYETTSKAITAAQSEVGELELSFIDLNKNIEKEMAFNYSLQNENDETVIFVKRNNTARLTLNE